MGTMQLKVKEELGLGSISKEMSSLYLIHNENIVILNAENLFEPKKDVDRNMAKQSNEFIIKMISHSHQTSPFVTNFLDKRFFLFQIIGLSIKPGLVHFKFHYF